MLKDYPRYNFTPEDSELIINFKTGMKLTIEKFIIYNDLNFVSTPSLGFQVQISNTTYPVRLFIGFITPDQKNTKVAEVNMAFQTEKNCNALIKIVDLNKEYIYSITMAYDIQPV